jgi:hypothetical protein
MVRSTSACRRRSAWFVPIPGITNARFNYRSERVRASKIMLFFDEHDALVRVSSSVEDTSASP